MDIRTITPAGMPATEPDRHATAAAPATTSPIYGLDIETDTSVDGLDPRVGRILAAAVAAADGTTVLTDDDEARLLQRLDAHLVGLEPGVVATWNGAAFDLPYLAARAERAGVRLALELVVDHRLGLRGAPLAGTVGACRATWGAHAHLDAYRLFATDVVPALGISGSLKSVARACGLAPVEVDAAAVHRLSPPELTAYVASDAACTRELVARRWGSARHAVDRLTPPSRGDDPVAVARPCETVG